MEGSFGSTHLEASQHRGHQLVHFQQTDVLANVGPGPGSKGKKIAIHLALLRLGCFDPPLWEKHLGVWTEDLLVPVDRPRRAADVGACREEFACHRHTSRGNDRLEDEPDSGMAAEGLLDDGAQIRKITHVGPPDEGVVRPEDAFLPHLSELVEQLLHRGRVPEEEVEDGPQRDGSGVGAGEDVGHGEREDALGGDELGVFVVGFDEAREEVSS